MLKYLLEKKKSIYTLLVFYWLTLLAATSIPDSSIPTWGVSDKIKHFAAYFILAALLNITFMVQRKFPALYRKPILFTTIITAVYGILDEFHQALIPGRSAEFLDWLADLGGILLAALLAWLIIRREPGISR